jgi:hypothetical protein
MDYPLFVAFYYDANPKYPVYAEGAKRLAAQCKVLGIPLRVTPVDLTQYMKEYPARNPRTVTLRRAVYRYIPIFVMQQLQLHQGPLLYLHCDSHILRRPPADAFKSDMAVGYSHRVVVEAGCGVFASPLFLNPSKRTCADFMELWRMKCQRIDSDKSEHFFLGLTVKDFEGCPDVQPFAIRISSESKADNPCILYGQGLTKAGGIV